MAGDMDFPDPDQHPAGAYYDDSSYLKPTGVFDDLSEDRERVHTEFIQARVLDHEKWLRLVDLYEKGLITL